MVRHYFFIDAIFGFIYLESIPPKNYQKVSDWQYWFKILSWTPRKGLRNIQRWKSHRFLFILIFAIGLRVSPYKISPCCRHRRRRRRFLAWRFSSFSRRPNSWSLNTEVKSGTQICKSQSFCHSKHCCCITTQQLVPRVLCLLGARSSFSEYYMWLDQFKHHCNDNVLSGMANLRL